MDTKKIRKSIGRFFGWLGLVSCSLIIKVIPERRLYGFAERLAGLGYFIARKQRKIALESLSFAFSHQKCAGEIEQIARNCFTMMAKAGVELLTLLNKPELLKERIQLVGKENLETALSKGKGVILASAHFGNFPLMLARLSLEGYKTAGVMRPMRDSRAEKIFFGKRKQFKINTIYTVPRKACVENCIRSLRNNELLFMPVDQNFGTAGIFVDFFGRKAATATGPVVLALRTKAALVPCFIVRQEDDTHRIVFEPASELKEGRDYQETVFINIQKLTNIIESYIYRYPAQWGWIHRRWKTKPS